MSIKSRHEAKVENAIERIEKYGINNPKAREGVHWLVFDVARAEVMQR
jgi:type IV secretory pathway ATPase VirB11/archaellum biosynthesis ATPase